MLFNLIMQIAKPLQCPDCDIDMRFLGSQPTKRVFISTILRRVFFLCPNCQRLSHRLVAMPLESITFAGLSFRGPLSSSMTTNPAGILGGSSIPELGLQSGQGQENQTT
jgi:hypothetical protein